MKLFQLSALFLLMTMGLALAGCSSKPIHDTTDMGPIPTKPPANYPGANSNTAPAPAGKPQ